MASIAEIQAFIASVINKINDAELLIAEINDIAQQTMPLARMAKGALGSVQSIVLPILPEHLSNTIGGIKLIKKNVDEDMQPKTGPLVEKIEQALNTTEMLVQESKNQDAVESAGLLSQALADANEVTGQLVLVASDCKSALTTNYVAATELMTTASTTLISMAGGTLEGCYNHLLNAKTKLETWSATL